MESTSVQFAARVAPIALLLLNKSSLLSLYGVIHILEWCVVSWTRFWVPAMCLGV